MDTFDQFLLDHAGDDTDRLLLGRDKWPSIDLDLAVHTIEGRRRLRTKVPSWYDQPFLRYPTRLCTEQCSSAATACFKAALATRILDGPGRIADLTGGLGVDAWAFSSVASEVLHNEMDPALSAAVRHNFALLGVRNVVFRNACVEPGTTTGILGGFQPDLIYLDPARRASDGHKVFRLEDCQPDVLRLLPELLGCCRHLLVKLSPMADISLIVSQLNQASGANGPVREVHVVGTDGECKELLLWIDRKWDGVFALQVDEIRDDEGHAASLSFPADAERMAVPVQAGAIGLADALLFEPGKTLAKAGLFNAVSERFGLRKFSRHTHLYLLPETGQPDAPITAFGKTYRILEVHEMSGKTLKAIGKTWSQADITARDLPLSSDDLRRRLGVRSGGGIHIFGCRIAGSPRLLVCRKQPEGKGIPPADI